MQQTFRGAGRGDGGRGVRLDADAKEQGYGIADGGTIIHELGGTKMGADPSTSVLNANCQAHDVPNLFVADGGPFVSQADKNPTWTIMALSWRTSDYIAAQRKAGHTVTRREPGIDRREALTGIGFSAMAAYGVGTPTWHRFQRLLAGGELRAFFTAAELALLGRLADMIIPSDERSGSATDSGALVYMDFVVGESSPKTQQAWRDGLKWYDEECQRRYSKVFVECSEAQRAALLDDVAWPAKAEQGAQGSRQRSSTGCAT